MKKSIVTVLMYVFSIAAFSIAYAQQNDTTKVVNLNEVVVKGYQSLGGMSVCPM